MFEEDDGVGDPEGLANCPWEPLIIHSEHRKASAGAGGSGSPLSFPPNSRPAMAQLQADPTPTADFSNS